MSQKFEKIYDLIKLVYVGLAGYIASLSSRTSKERSESSDKNATDYSQKEYSDDSSVHVSKHISNNSK